MYLCVGTSLAISVYSKHLFGEGGIPPPKKLTIAPQTAAKLCAI